MKPFFLVSLALLAFCACFPGCHSGKARVFRVGIINWAPVMDPVVMGFKQGMTALGYIEGENVLYVEEPGNFDSDDVLKKRARKMVQEKVDVVFTVGTKATRIASDTTAPALTPIVFAGVDDPVGQGFINSPNRPGGQLTGISYFGLHEGPRLAWLLKADPMVKRVFLPYFPSEASTSASIPEIRKAAGRLGIELQLRPLKTAEDLDAALQEAPGDAEAIILPPDNVITSRMDDWVKVALARKIPLCVPNQIFVRNGALMSYGFAFMSTGRQASRLVERVLQGSPPGEVPVEMPDFLLSINLSTAEAIGLSIPDDLLRQADEIIR